MSLWETVDLSRDLVIEASAGTGKTYTIERLVGRMALEQQVALENILLVTYTEKAAGEMRDRVRAYLTELLDGTDGDGQAFLRRQIEDFDQAGISTIHGFCQRVLREYAFENGQPWRLELTDEADMTTSALRRIMRRDWTRTEQVADAIAAVGNIDNLEKVFSDLAKHCRSSKILGPDNVIATARELRTALDSRKTRLGLVTYDDMLLKVRDALNPALNPAAPALAAALRRKYHKVLVDEFQDTDPVQWEIFKNLFADSPEHTLIVVGDPKQAIYSFRGADVNTYLQAKHEIDNQAELDVNFRSTPELIDSFNQLFHQESWFGSGNIGYGTVKAPPDECRLCGIDHDTTGRTPVVAVRVADSTKDSSAPPISKRMAEFTANEIKHHLDNPEVFRFSLKNNASRTVEPGDFCILVRTRNDARFFEKALRRQGIPYAFYKKTGIYQSDAAVNIKIMLDALAAPANEVRLRKAVLSDFIAVPFETVSRHRLSGDPELGALMDKWLDLTERRRWAELFRSLLEDSGLLWRVARGQGGERALADYRQIFEELELAAVAKSLDMFGVAELMTQWMRELIEVDADSELHRIESDTGAVKIMTMHASKGLQFPFVFIGDRPKISIANAEKTYSYHNAEGRRVVCLPEAGGRDEEQKEAKPQATNEMRAEQKRLFYVAFTRARFRVYAPFGEYMTGKKTPRSKPVDDLLTPALGVLVEENPGIEVEWTAGGGFNEPGVMAAGDPRLPEKSPPPAVKAVFPRPGNIHSSRRRIDSFSAISGHGRNEDNHYFGESTDRMDEDDMPDATAMNSISPPLYQLLPPGKQTGNTIHDIMEALCGGHGADFADLAAMSGGDAVANPAVTALAERAMAANGLKNSESPETGSSTRSELVLMAWRALNTPIGSGNIILGQLPPGDRVAEMEFHLAETDGILTDGATRRDLMTGFIDLLFRHDGKYYILDWKSNTLPNYRPETVAAAIVRADYHLQYRIYTLAVLAWLRSMGMDGGDFGGVIYLFTRGVGGDDDGVFFETWNPAMEPGWREFVAERLRR